MTRLAGRLLAAAAASLFLASTALAADAGDPIPVPRLSGRVVDLAGTLQASDRAAISEKLAAFERSKGSQVAVLLVPTIGTETIEDFATRVTDQWKLGRAGVDDGVLFVIAMKERRMRIQTGRGVQGVLTDALSRRIIAERVSPRFRAGDFAGGVNEGVDAILKAIEGESLPAPPPSSRERRATGVSFDSLETFAVLAFAVVPIVGAILRSLVGRFLGATLTSGATGIAAWLVFGSAALGIIAALVALFAVLFMGVTSIGSGRGGGWGGGGWGGGGWSSGGGGGGGFSGGGGSFDGGGASGNW